MNQIAIHQFSKNSVYRIEGLCHSKYLDSYRVSSKQLGAFIHSQHPGLELCFSNSHFQDFIVGRENILAAPRQLVLHNSRDRHTEVYYYDRDSDYFSVTFRQEFVDELLRPIGLDVDKIGIDQFLYDVSSKQMRNLTKLIQFRDFVVDPIIEEACMIDLLSELLESTENTAREQIRNAFKFGKYPSVDFKIKKYLWENFKNKDLDLETLSRDIGVSKFHMSRMFSSENGLSLGKYLTALRMNEAETLLRKSTLKVAEIAGECGYENNSTFHIAFKKTFGSTPLAMKKSLRSS